MTSSRGKNDLGMAWTRAAYAGETKSRSRIYMEKRKVCMGTDAGTWRMYAPESKSPMFQYLMGVPHADLEI